MHNNGWVKVYRKLFDSQFGGNIEMIGLFTSLLLKANHREAYTHDGTKIKAGQFMTSQLKLAREFRISRETLRRKLKMLENAQQIKQHSSNKNTVITILNWDKYQGGEQDFEQQVSNKWATSEHQVSTNKNDNNNNNENNILSYEKIDNQLLDKIIQSWNTICASHKNLKHHKATKPSTAKKFIELVNINPEFKKIESWETCFESIKENQFLNGSDNSSGFVCTLNWLIDKHTIVDVLNGQYGANNNKPDFSGLDSIVGGEA